MDPRNIRTTSRSWGSRSPPGRLMREREQRRGKRGKRWCSDPIFINKYKYIIYSDFSILTPGSGRPRSFARAEILAAEHYVDGLPGGLAGRIPPRIVAIGSELLDADHNAGSR